MADEMRELVMEQRRRLVASILKAAEEELGPHVPKPKYEEYRRHVLNAIGNYHNLILDVIKVRSDDVRNVQILELLQDVHRGVLGLRG